MRSDDLVPVLAKPSVVGTGFRQGLIVTWDQETAQNTVMVNGTLLTNLPILNTSEAAILAAGDVVGIMTFGNTIGIMGRFTIPGTPEAVSALSSLRTTSESISSSDSITSTSYAAAPSNPGPEVSITVGPTGRLLVIVSATISTQTSVAANNTALTGGAMGVELTGANSRSASDSETLRVTSNVLTNSSANTTGIDCSASRAILLTGLTPGLTTITARYRRLTSSTSVNVSNRNVTALAI